MLSSMAGAPSGSQTRSQRSTSGSSAPDRSIAGPCASNKEQAACAPNRDRRARISNGGLVYSFATKDGLVRAALEREVTRFEGAKRRRFAGPDDRAAPPCPDQTNKRADPVRLPPTHHEPLPSMPASSQRNHR